MQKQHSNEQLSQSSLIAQEGFVVSADSNKTWGCPLENDRDPIAILSEFEFIYIWDNGILHLPRGYCIWRFTAPQKYGFKVVIIDLDVAADTKLFIRNSTDTFVK
uniref:Uncharacterized protein n=1 Tax=Panagrolaimus davidi TaxID=227884 RepID=A0A914Q7H3_9BILA